MDFAVTAVGSPPASAPVAPVVAAPPAPVEEPKAPDAAGAAPAPEPGRDPATGKFVPGEKQEPLSPRFAQLARKERQLVARQQALQAEIAADRAKLEEERKALSGDRERVSRFEQARQTAKLDPQPFLQELFGEQWYEFLTEYKLNGGKTNDPVALLEAARKTAREEYESARKREADEAAASQQKTSEQRAVQEKEEAARVAKAVAEFKTGLTDRIKAAGDKFEFITEYGLYDRVYARMDALLQQYPSATVEQLETAACEQIEKQMEGELGRAAKLKKFSAQYQPVKQEQPTPAAPPAPAAPRTLSNHVPSAPVILGEPQSESERLARAMAAMDAALARARAPQT